LTLLRKRRTLPAGAGNGAFGNRQVYGAKSASPISYDERLQRVLTSQFGADLYADPVQWANKNGLSVYPADVDNVLEDPDALRSVLVDALQKISQARASGGKVAATSAAGRTRKGKPVRASIASHLLQGGF
jgi:hypothetical protein